MINYLFIFLTALATTVLAMPFAQIMGRRMNAWDVPDGLSYRTHLFQLARTGGIAIAMGLYAGLLAVMLINPGLMGSRNMIAYMIGGMVVFLVGLLDDLREIKPWVKAVLLLAACLVTVLIMTAVPLTGYERLDFLLAVLVLMGGCNAFNLMDGMDGLAAGMAVAAGLGLLLLSLQLQTFEGISLKLVCMGAALGFLHFNRPPARIFMGDCGSLMLGFYLAGMGLNIVRTGPGAIIPVLLVLSPFVLDTGLAIVRRLLGKRDVFTGDRRHVYDLLQARTLSVWRVDWMMWGLGLFFSALGYAALFLPPWQQAALLAAAWLAFTWRMAGLGMFAPEKPGGPGRPALPEVEDMDLDQGANG
ncbi:MAG: hypothetical protein A2509_10685 [Candidatus Edwardsbacteria bacterium RIFOXYD12_FULL_50_11]|nr:MAG: hypothetical protein A2502_09390 [Candidatus Edwardsbacteria bacterium RifOxyC12_full_54_24]OGF07206.1 MAG: hypothetical protein A2273_01665 [Candidatus Edwardsbacteria bacterium RifOxyA12_full_54_48]OGF09461.1 MAG: hypothetical protein A3K15_08075 [Candidatus Edwardsbacteria bacterium GWE2_54_12]OGF17273.1 MAG: hypothetical protein A2509_10685 [Candidatus Edwardsbacteria bacterium RIFOXYD12_FULL_50_11]OGJ18421.1 MAG: hypothetical protein A2349_00430 [Candidatus Edwardsbacteria bacteriu